MMKARRLIVAPVLLSLTLPFGPASARDAARGQGADVVCACANAVTDKEPVVTKRVNPVYPEEAKAKGLEGKVYVSILVDTGGKVKEAKVLKSDNPVFDTAALDAARQWLFSPAIKDGKAVEVLLTMPFMFKLADKK
jgi:TonB family protein